MDAESKESCVGVKAGALDGVSVLIVPGIENLPRGRNGCRGALEEPSVGMWVV